MGEPGLRHNNIDALRLILAVLVIYSHSYPLGTGSELAEPLLRATRGQLTLGGLAVDWFFVLSGFLIAQSWERIDAFVPFLAKRARRIYPGFVAAVAICSWVVVPLASAGTAGTFSLSHLVEFIEDVPRLLLPAYSGTFTHNAYPGPVNGSLWSIPFEFWCYIGVALLGVSRVLRRRSWVAALFLLTIPVHLAFEVTQIHPGGGVLGKILGYPPIWARMLPLYLAGVVYYHYRDWLKPRGMFAMAALLGLGVAARIPHAMVVALPTLGTYLLFYLAFNPHVCLHGFAKHGDFSYGVYLYAFPIQQLIVQWAGGKMSQPALFWSALPASLAVGAASWFGVERYFLVRSKKKAPTAAEVEVGVGVVSSETDVASSMGKTD
jgi:peptidoglycan/LPS O-acetylase OafA/YrhL